jgi:hypothetical protein
MNPLLRRGRAYVTAAAAGMLHRALSFMVYQVCRGLPETFPKTWKISLRAMKYGRRPERFDGRRLGEAVGFDEDAVRLGTVEPVFDSGREIAASVDFKDLESFHGRRVAVMAHFDPDGLFDPYLSPYLRHLKGIGFHLIVAGVERLVFVDESRGLLSACVTRSERGYDFTSWRAAFQCFPDLFEAEELVLCNDSVLAPLNSFRPIHEMMDSRDFDFWGLCESREMVPHLQSYYLVFKRRAVASPRFRKFFSSVVSRDRDEAIRTEVGLTGFLAREGLKPGAYVSAASLPVAGVNPIDYYWPVLIDRFGFPCLKKNLLLGSAPWLRIDGWRGLLKEKGYPLKLVDDYRARVGGRLRARFTGAFARKLKDKVFALGTANRLTGGGL